MSRHPYPDVADLPEGYAARPLSVDDAQAVTDVMAAQELHDTGEVVIELADIVGDWQRPAYDVGDSTVGVLGPGGVLVGYAEHTGGDRGDASVHPDHRGRGIGTWLAAWMRAKAAERGAAVVGMPVPEGSPGHRLLAALGYEQRWTSWVLALPEGREVVPQPLPEGYAVRAATDDDLPAVHTVLEDAFLEWSEREREPFEDFLARSVQRPGHAPWMLQVVVDPAGEVVGACHVVLSHAGEVAEGYVNRIAVRRDRRGLGLARALLAESFAVARAHGAVRSGLSTDSRTGALGLYERVGMEVTATWVNLAARL